MEEVIEKMLGFGKFQKLATVLIGSTSLLNGMAVYSTVFTDAYPHCRNQANLSSTSNSSGESSCGECLEESSVFGMTSPIEWKLACGSSYLYMLQTFYMIGAMLSLFVGYMSDRFGRKRVSVTLLGLATITITTSQLLISRHVGLGLNVPLKYAIYSTSKLLLGTLCVGLFNVTYVLLFELVSHKHVTLVSNVNVYMFVLGELVVALLSYLFKSWHVINWFIAAYSLLVLVLAALFLPESPRFLIVHKRFDELYARLKYIARVNGKEASFESMNENEVIDRLCNWQTTHQTDTFVDQSHTNEGIFTYVIKSRRRLWSKVVFLSYTWLSLNLVYFGISLGNFCYGKFFFILFRGVGQNI